MALSIIAIKSDTKMSKRGVKDVCSVTGTVHPEIHNSLRGRGAGTAGSNILTRCPCINFVFRKYRKIETSIWSDMIEFFADLFARFMAALSPGA